MGEMSCSRTMRESAVNSCWHFLGFHNVGGYGYVRYMGKQQLAHRVSYQIHVGAIPKGLGVLHRCDNPPCINPRHLYVGNQSQNNRDAYRRERRSASGELNSQSKIGESEVLLIRALYMAGVLDQVQLAKRFPLRQTSIGNIVRGDTWPEVKKLHWNKHG